MKHDLRGLTEGEAQARLRAEGANDLPSPEHHSFWGLLAEVMREPMFILLLGSAVLYALIGDLGEAAVLALFASVSVSIALIQRGRSEKVLEALRDLSSPRALVIREGRRMRIPGREVVRGDLIVIAEGDRVPADAVLMEGDDIHVDESLLTGESLPVAKRVATDDDVSPARPGGEGLPYLYSGTLVLSGNGVATVNATGERSEIGKIGHAVRSIESEQPRLQAQTRRIVLVLAVAGALFSLGAVLLYGVLRGEWIQGLLAGIALGMSMLPEEFPLVLAVFTVMGAWRLSRSRVLTRRAATIETLGAATVLCTDKTGTLTQNQMTVVAMCDVEGVRWHRAAEPPMAIVGMPGVRSLLEAAVLASEPKGFDPMDRAVHQLAHDGGAVLTGDWQRLRLYPLQPNRLAVTAVWRSATGESSIVAAKGAPETIAQLCGMEDATRTAMRKAVNGFATRGMRVLGVASGEHRDGDLPQDPASFALTFVGLVALTDPLRPSVPEAVRECRAAGIRVVMITGDYPETARAIAHEAGIADGNVLTGAEVAALPAEDLAARVRETTVFARIAPQQKLRIVEALKRNGEVVAMTGDGVNDAPALKAAHIGIAMGGRGTDVAREASSLVLLDDDFGSIVRAIRLGRRIYDNLRKAMTYIVSIHVPIAGLALLPILLGQPLLLTPMLIAFMELIIDPACSIVLEAEHEERNVMNRPPRDPQAALLSRSLLQWGVVQGALGLVVASAVYGMVLYLERPEDEIRTIMFVTLVAVNLALILASRTLGGSLASALGRPNAALGWGLSIVVVMVGVVVAMPGLRAFLGLAEISWEVTAGCVIVALLLLVSLQLLKALGVARIAQ